jgi:hypothetical protein
MNKLQQDRALLSQVGPVTVPEYAFIRECSWNTANARLRALWEAVLATRAAGSSNGKRGKRPWVYEVKR